jgi:hypothetical protein
VESKYGAHTIHGRQYRCALELIRDWAKIEQPVYSDVWAGVR